MYEACCICLTPYMSHKKCLSVVPWAPLFAIIMLSITGAYILDGVERIIATIGIQFSPGMQLGTRGAVLGAIMIDLIFAYSVLSNKLRIHNAHCNAEGCRGYRIKDAPHCCAKMLRVFCKFYNGVLITLAWFTLLVVIFLAICLAWFAGGVLLVVTLCGISRPAIDTLLLSTSELQNVAQESVLGGLIYVETGTNSSMVCDQSPEIIQGGMQILVSAPIALLAQTIMMLSFLVVWEVSWRHMKDNHREGERAQQRAQVDDEMEFRRMQLVQSRAIGTMGAGMGGGMGGMGGMAMANCEGNMGAGPAGGMGYVCNHPSAPPPMIGGGAAGGPYGGQPSPYASQPLNPYGGSSYGADKRPSYSSSI